MLEVSLLFPKHEFGLAVVVEVLVSVAWQRGQSFTACWCEWGGCNVRVQREDAVCEEQSPSLFPSALSGPAARLTHRQEVSPPVGKDRAA